MSQKNICFIGAGNMTYGIVSGLINSGYSPQLISVTNPSRPKLDAMAADFGIHVFHDNVEAADLADIIVLSVKPQFMQVACEQLSSLDLSQKLIITIAAGIKAQRYPEYVKQPIKLIRTIPNTPTQIGMGFTGLFAEEGVSYDQKRTCEQLMTASGEILWFDKEQDLNDVLALSSSSPAYFFLFMEAMVESAVKNGIEENKARQMAQQAALGAAQMVKHHPEMSLEQLRLNVTSKGGVTAEAVDTFEKGNLRGLVDEAMSNCIARAEEIAEQF
ncbi:pyrroline-5-carboxylate reductase [Shewanella surugensis]|uniref:Pyrroline-5-carboxylate reductase n=1 Tax=Shewanella surugensis TaxID=212020 RepID=A0ABT0LFQ9_9GAMM|nr:pyrroline-5-carboxylate reductase [Shewanella surugensis]MCL1126541.1 pyrroline-5-carboxylate reductase [Shewanella surugensis]